MDFLNFLKRLGRVVEEATVEVKRDVSYSQLWSRVNSELVSQYDGWVWVDDIYQDSGGDQYAIVVKDGKLWRHSITMNGVDVEMGEAVEVEVNFTDVSRTFRTIHRVNEDGTEEWRWIAIAATSTLNRVGELDSRALFDDFKQRADDGEEDYPYLTVVHTDRALEIGQADFLWREKNVYINSGLWDFEGENGELARAFAKATENNEDDLWGISIGFIPLEREILVVNDDIEIPVYTRGIHVETSILLEADAANNLTTVMNIERNMVMASKALENALDVLFDGDEDKIAAEIKKVDAANRTIDRTKMITRDAKDAEDVEDDTEETEDDADIEVEVDATTGDVVVEFSDEIEQAIAQRVTHNLLKSMERQQQQLEALSQRAENLEAELDTERKARTKAEKRLAALERSDEEKGQDFLERLPRKTIHVQRPRDRGVEDDQPLGLDAVAEGMMDRIPKRQPV